MIFDVLKSALKAPSDLIPVATLLANCAGSRMPDVCAEALTAEIAAKAVKVCPTEALRIEMQQASQQLRLDYGECIGCGRCVEAAPGAFISAQRFTQTGVARAELIRRWDLLKKAEIPSEPPLDAVRAGIFSLLGRALNIRQLDAGSCNGCEAEITALTNPYYDLERFGIHFVASPKHADMLFVTGPVTRNMAEAVRKTYEAVPEPKLVVAVGACGVSGGLFAGNYAIAGAVDSVIPVDGYIPGCPPTPAMLITGILEVLRRKVQMHGSERGVMKANRRNRDSREMSR
jgi:Ni,Fe-hydrogenase III small subunit/ferredoxin